MPSEAARGLRALKAHSEADWVLQDIEAEDAERAAQADTPEAHEAKEQWVKTIIATALRDVAKAICEPPYHAEVSALRHVADKLDPPKARSEAAKTAEMLRNTHIPSDPYSPVCGQKRPVGQHGPCASWRLGPGDTMQYRDAGSTCTIAALFPDSTYFYSTDGGRRDVRDWHRVALAKIEPGMAVEYYADPEVRPIHALVRYAASYPRGAFEQQFTIILQNGGQMDANRGDLCLLVAPKEGKA